jgi:hypothetical protein
MDANDRAQIDVVITAKLPSSKERIMRCAAQPSCRRASCAALAPELRSAVCEARSIAHASVATVGSRRERGDRATARRRVDQYQPVPS